MSGIYEEVDNTPVEIPTRLRLPQSRTDQIRQFIREEMSRKAAADGVETFEEADDVEPDDEDYMPYSPYEVRELGLAPDTPLAKQGEGVAQPPADPAASSKVPPAPVQEAAEDGSKPS